jgi:hypothetical protein
MLDKDAIRFHAAMMRVALDQYGASVEGGGETYRDVVYAAYKAAGAPKDQAAWLKEYFAKEFQSVGDRPRWVEEEPAWPFRDGRPMVFISQTTLPDNEVTRTALVSSDTLYVFGARVPAHGGFELAFEVVHQAHDE